MNVDNSKSVLISPLCWGLGHATRIIPVIRAFENENCRVSILAHANLIAYLQERFPELNYHVDTSSCISYRKGMGFFKMLGTAIKLLTRYKREQKTIRKLLRKTHFDIIVSDNRYGIWNRSCRNILITHQLKPIISGFYSLFTKKVHRYIDAKIANFDHVWIPDYKDRTLSGALSQSNADSDKFNYIGLLSRFENSPIVANGSEEHSYLIITSGPREHRVKMTDYFIKRNRRKNEIIKIIGEAHTTDIPEHIEIINNPGDELFAKLVSSAACIITHSGYSTLMDLIMLGKSAIIIPTHGQSEQKYLAKRLQKHFVYAPNLHQAIHFIDIHIDELPPQTLKPQIFLKEKIRQILLQLSMN